MRGAPLRIGAALVWLIGANAAAAQPPAEAVGRFEFAYPFPSPDGATVVVQGNVDGRWQLYAIAAGDGAIRRLHVSDGDDTHPAFSPDGRRIAFISNRDGNDEAYVLDLASGDARPVAPHPGKDGHPKWSADGAWLVFNRTFDPADREGDLDSAIVRVRPDGSELTVIADSERVETFPSFSPDGRSVAFVEWFPGADGTPNRNGEIVLVDLASGARRNITNSERFEAFPYWGASGEWIYFAAAEEGPAGREATAQRIGPDGTRRQLLAPLDGMAEARPVPSADERLLWFNISVDGRMLIYRLPIAAE